MLHLVELLVPLGGMALTFGIVYFAITTSHKERMRLIESGADPELFYNKSRRKGGAIKVGALLMGVGLGVLLGNMFVTAGLLTEDAALPSMILLCGGAGLLLGNYFANKAQEQDEKK